MPAQLTRTGFLATALLAAAAPAALAAGPSDIDLANARVLVAVELLLADFYGRALKADRLGASGRDALERARFNEGEHLAAVSGVLTGAGQTPATADDIDFAYPARTFESRGGIATVGVKLERLALGAYLGAVASVQSPSLKLPFAQIAACEARHLTVFEAETTGHALDNSFGDPLTIDEASNELSAYTG
jgi:hypothetical protein